MKSKIYNPKDGYNIIAPYYDNWKWQKFWHKNEYPYIKEWCDSLSCGRGLDLGTGSGNNLECFLSKGNKVTAIDLSLEMLNICKKKYKKEILKGNLECLELDIRDLSDCVREYDWIVSNRAFSHIKHIDTIIEKMSHIIKCGGQCFISDIHPLHHYENTNLTIKDSEICIETYKHKMDDVVHLLLKHNFKIIDFKEVGINDLINKDIIDYFPSLCNQDSPIFYYYIIKYTPYLTDCV